MKNGRIIFLVVALLSGCSLFSPVNLDMTEYQINARAELFGKSSHSRRTLMVTPTEANAIYDTTDMAYTTKAYKIAYFSKNRWAATPPEMITPLIVDALQQTRHYKAVSPATSTGAYDYVLNTQLIELRQVFYHQLPSEVHVKLRAEIIRSGTNRVIAAKEFVVVETAQQNTPYSGVVAANKAVAKLLGDLARFCVEHS